MKLIKSKPTDVFIKATQYLFTTHMLAKQPLTETEFMVLMHSLISKRIFKILTRSVLPQNNTIILLSDKLFKVLTENQTICSSCNWLNHTFSSVYFLIITNNNHVWISNYKMKYHSNIEIVLSNSTKNMLILYVGNLISL